jgi:uncharacterized protein (TIGR02444 family)
VAIWDWALDAYARPGVPDACLTLQDVHGQNTSLLLWAAWAKVDDPALLGRAAAVARNWEGLALGPLRSVRRALKPSFEGVSDAARLALRDEVKAAELQAERVLLESLEALGAPGGGAPALAALKAASQAWGNATPDDALAALAAALG